MRCAIIGVLAVLCGCGRTDLSPDAGTVDAGALDAGVLDSGVLDAGQPGCRSEVSPLSGKVRFEFPQQPCRFTLAQAAAGISFRYAVVVSSLDPQFIESAPSQSQTCAQVQPGVGIYVFEKIAGDAGTVYCLCDQGLCMQAPISLGATPGRTELNFAWDGRSWFGPSDTGNPKGPPLPAGEYVFSIESTVGDSRTDPAPSSVVRGSLHFALVP